MNTISKSKLKAQMLRIFRELEEEGEELVVTDHGRPVLRIQPIGKKRPSMRSSVRIWGRLSISRMSIPQRWRNGACRDAGFGHFRTHFLDA